MCDRGRHLLTSKVGCWEEWRSGGVLDLWAPVYTLGSSPHTAVEPSSQAPRSAQRHGAIPPPEDALSAGDGCPNKILYDVLFDFPPGPFLVQ